jgi:hypothetical protein
MVWPARAGRLLGKWGAALRIPLSGAKNDETLVFSNTYIHAGMIAGTLTWPRIPRCCGAITAGEL